MSVPVEEKTFYVLYDDGSIGRIVTDTGTEPVLPKPGRIVTEAEYRSALDAHAQTRAQRIADEQAAETAAKQAAYEALVEVGVPAASAEQISGYRPPGQEPQAA